MSTADNSSPIEQVDREEPQASKKRIGEILVDLGYCTLDQVTSTLDSDADEHLQLGTRLINAGVIDDVKLAHALSVRVGVGFTDLTHLTDINQEAVARVPERLARRYTLIPIDLQGSVLSLAMASPGNVFAIDAVRAATGLRVDILAAPERAIRKAIERCYGFALDLESISTEMASVELSPEEEAESSLDIEQLLSVAEDAPVVKYVDSLVSRAIHDRASDIHIEPGRESVTVRLRVDGKLRLTVAPPKAMQNAVISRIKILSSLDIAEKRLPLDGRLHLRFQGRDVDLRVSTLPTIHGEKVVLRILDKTALQLDLDSLGGTLEFQGHLQTVLRRPNGIVLVTGPTGSGKSTTLYACLNYVRDITKNIVTVEDPVEYEMDAITQIAARADIGMTFARALRAILRQDPDIVMVGEIRDLETLEIAIRASLTGHLVLSTLHTNDAVSTITRMINMQAEPYLIASTLASAIAQRLVRRICPECKKEVPLTDEERDEVAKVIPDSPPKALWKGSGCALCGKTGYYGRSAVFEYFHIDETARQMITHQASDSELRDHQRKTSSGSLLDNAFHKAVEGVTTFDEAMQFAKDS